MASLGRVVLVATLVLAAHGIGQALGHDDIATHQLREYYLAAVDVEWDYAPSGKNLIKNTDITPDSYEADFLLNGPHRIGRKYKKAVYKQFTDDTYTVEIPKPVWLGTLGPILYAEVGDTIFVHFKNLASIPLTVHPHGMKYDKDSEGAVYEDMTSGKDKADEMIKPGGSHRFKWKANVAAGPAEPDVNCVPWPYHSHISTPSGTNTGAMGALIICKEGILDENGQRKDVDKDFVVMVTILDENLSYFIDENINTYAGNPDTLDPEDEDFVRSNQKDSMNGYLYGNLPGLDMCVGDKVDWHVMAFGTEADIHTMYFHGNSLISRGHRKDTVSLSPAVLFSGTMEALNPGIWLLASASTTHFKDGAQALYNVSDACGTAPPLEPPTGQREYFIAAEEVAWDYAPFTRTNDDGSNFTDPDRPSYPFFTKDMNFIGGTYQKARFLEYTDSMFSSLAPREAHLGILGPILRGEVGDTLRVTVMNRLNGRNISVQPHGVMYDKASEGQAYNDGTAGADHFDEIIMPGSSYTYVWSIPEHFGPTSLDSDCLTWIYTSAVDQEADIFAGLVGPLLICKKGALDSAGKQLNVDQEFFLLFTTFDENLSGFLSKNIEMYSANASAVDRADEDFVTSNQMASINGYSYYNLDSMTMALGDRVSWHVMAVGKFSDAHIALFNGRPFIHNSQRKVGVTIFPGVSETVIMNPIMPGTFKIKCSTNTHNINGMDARFTVTAPDNATLPEPGESTRTYYLGIVERYWDYAMDKWDPVRSEDLNDPGSTGYVFVSQGDTSIGSRYMKALYREYTDDTFLTEVERKDTEQHLGVQGPMLRMEVGETVTLVVKNMASRTYNLGCHGVLSFTDPSGGNGVAPGETKSYKWKVTENAGPSATDPNCIVSAYYSSVDRARDINSGLVGTMVICRPGILGDDGCRMDVNKEFSLLFTVMDENKSWYLDQNIQEFCGRPDMVDPGDPDFEESNLMHGINGFLFHNLKHLNMSYEDTVEWYLLGLGDEVDVHSVHFHGQPVTYRASMVHRVDVFELFSGVYGSVQMHADNPGTWLLHCHVNDHILGGMETSYIVGAAPTKMPEVPSTTAASACCIASTTVIIILGVLLARKFN